jgi:hypothetical protein
MTLIDKIRATDRTARFLQEDCRFPTETEHQRYFESNENKSITLVICIHTQNVTSGRK